MPISHFVVIDDQDVSPWVMSVRAELAIPGTYESFVQQCDVTLSNVGGKFDEAFGGAGFGPQSKMLVALRSIEYDRSGDETTHTALVFTGYCQKIDTGYLTVEIKGGDATMRSNSAVYWDVHKHHGQSTEPIWEDLIQMYNLNKGKLVIPEGMEKREWLFLRDHDGKSVIDYLSEWDGCETFINEQNQVMHVPPTASISNPSYTGRMKLPSRSESAVGFCNRVTVRGGSFRRATDVGSEHLPTDAVYYTTTEDDLAYVLGLVQGGSETAQSIISQYGWIDAPTSYVPELTTVDQCRARALRMLSKYITYWKRNLPAVVGRTPTLQSAISYQYKRMIPGELISGAGRRSYWQLGPEQSGRVVRVRTEYTPKAGWVSYIEVQPNMLSFEANELYSTTGGA